MTALKLTYFDIDGGRAEPIRLALKLGGILFEDDRFPMAEFPEIKHTLPLGQVPVLAVNGHVVTQTNSLLRYVGKLTKLYPEDDFQALLCDEVLSALEDVVNKFVATFHLKDQALLEARIKLINGALTTLLKWLADTLFQGGGKYFIDNQLSISDLKVFVWVRTLNSGVLDHIPTDIVSQVSPSLNEHMNRLLDNPIIKEHYCQP